MILRLVLWLGLAIGLLNLTARVWGQSVIHVAGILDLSAVPQDNRGLPIAVIDIDHTSYLVEWDELRLWVRSHAPRGQAAQ